MEFYNKSDNYEAWAAWQCVCNTNVNVFLTGNAGTGKTTFLKNLRQHCLKRMVVVAPTGVAAINAGGVTIHSFFQISPGVHVPGAQETKKHFFKMRESRKSLIRSLDLLIIDEISMVRADLLDAVDAELKSIRRNANPFGGIQILLVGDLRQLSPVVRDGEEELLSAVYTTPYFFGSKALQALMQANLFYSFELKKIYRQADQSFVDILNKVRVNQLDDESLRLLNSRYDPNFKPADDQKFIRLTTHNAQADSYNNLKLSMLDGKAFTYDASVSGTYPDSSFPIESRLILKQGAQVMFLKNDPTDAHRFYNGKIGHVVSLSDEQIVVSCDDSVGNIIVDKYVWENTQPEIDPDSGNVENKVVGKFTHYPLRLAWAITIHKSQGLTFDRAIIDAGRSFSPGQVYVALSRCRSLQGLVLSSIISPSSIMTDSTVNGFLQVQQANVPSEDRICQLHEQAAYDSVVSLFSFQNLHNAAARVVRVFDEHLYRVFPKALEQLKALLFASEGQVLSVGFKFLAVCNQALASGATITQNDELLARIAKGAAYFFDLFPATYMQMLHDSNVSLDNKAIADQLNNARNDFSDLVSLHSAMLQAVAAHGFSSDVIAKAKADIFAHKDDPTKASKQKSDNDDKVTVVVDINNKELYDELRVWRQQKAEAEGKKLFMVLSNSNLISVTNKLPINVADLLTISGIGKAKADAYGAELIAIVDRHRDDVPQPRSVSMKVDRNSPEASEAKAPKVRAADKYLALFRKMNSIEKVAEFAQVTTSTVKGHLLRGVPDNGLSFDQIMGPGVYKKLRAKLADVRKPLSEDLRAELISAGFNFADIYFVLDEFEAERKAADNS